MYIIGNSGTSRPVPMWAEVLSILERSNKIGPSLALYCLWHKETPIEVSVPDEVARLAPEGGCAKRCSPKLLCGHSCPNMCHSTSLQNVVRCLERCLRTKKVASISIRDLAEIYASQNAKSYYLTLFTIWTHRQTAEMSWGTDTRGCSLSGPDRTSHKALQT